MTDIVDRLRKMAEADYYGRDQPHFVSPDECADEIERLTALVRKAYNEAFAEGMREHRQGGKTWYESDVRAALEAKP